MQSKDLHLLVVDQDTKASVLVQHIATVTPMQKVSSPQEGFPFVKDAVQDTEWQRLAPKLQSL